MKTARKSRLGTWCAAVTTAALVVSTAFIPVAADSSVDALGGGAEYLDGTDLGDYAALSGSTTTEISVSGSVNTESLGDLSLNADVTMVVDHDAGAQSMTGAIQASGVSYEFAEYMDADAILLKIPGLPKVLSYNYQTLAEDSYLAQMVGAENLNVINNALKLNYASLAGGPEVERYAQEITTILTDTFSQLEVSEAPEKECRVGDGTVSCTGYQAVITKDVALDTANKLLAVQLPNGQTFEEYINMLLAISNSGSDSDVEEVSGSEDAISLINNALEDMPDLTGAVYLNNNFPVELSLTAEGSTIALQLRGPETAPWSEIALVNDDEDAAVINVSVEGSVYKAVVSASGSEVATFSFDTEAMTYEANIPALGSPITGTFNVDGDAFVFTASYNDLQISARTTEGGTVTKPEGEVLELTTMTAEDFQAISSEFASLFTDSEAASAAPAA